MANIAGQQEVTAAVLFRFQEPAIALQRAKFAAKVQISAVRKELKAVVNAALKVGGGERNAENALLINPAAGMRVIPRVTAALTTKHGPVRKNNLILTIPEKMNLEMKSEITILQ